MQTSIASPRRARYDWIVTVCLSLACGAFGSSCVTSFGVCGKMSVLLDWFTIHRYGAMPSPARLFDLSLVVVLAVLVLVLLLRVYIAR